MNRNREPYHWERVWASRGSFVPTPTPVLAEQNIEELSRSAASDAVPIARWVIPIAGLAAPAVVWGSGLMRALAGLGVALTSAWIAKATAMRRSIAETHAQSLQADFVRDRDALGQRHVSEMEQLARDWATEEARLSQVRTAPENGDLEILSGVLEAELQNEPLPVPLILDLEMESVHVVKVEFLLPDLDEVPATRTSLTKTGKLSSRNMTQRDRIELYNDLCTSIALRLVDETHRVLNTVDVVEVFGVASGIDPGTGHLSDFVSLHVRASRSQMANLNLDAVDPSSALSMLDGSFACDRKGVLMPLPDVHGLQD